MASRKLSRRPTYHHGDLRAALIHASLALIERRGVRGFTMTDAAKAAGVTVAAPYRHFADRDALLATIAELGFSMLAADLEAAAAAHADGPGGPVMAMAVAYVDFARGHRAHFRAMFEAESDKASSPDLSRAGDRAFAALASATKQLTGPRASPAKRASVTAAVWALVHGFAMLETDAAFQGLERELPAGELLRGALRFTFGAHVK